MSKWDLRRQMAAGGLVAGLLVGLLGGYTAHYFKPVKTEPLPEPIAVAQVDDGVRVRGVVGGEVLRVVLTDGRTAVAEESQQSMTGSRYKVGGRWYDEVK